MGGIAYAVALNPDEPWHPVNQVDFSDPLDQNITMATGKGLCFGGNCKANWSTLDCSVISSEHNTWEKTRECPAGYIVLGGGCRCTGGELVRNSPASLSSWRCVCDTGATKVKVYRTCCRLT